MKVQNIGLALGLAFLGVLQQVSSAKALEYKIKWSGASFGNNAVAEALINFDPSGITPGGTRSLSPSSFSMTMAGAGTGNGTFGLSNYTSFLLTIKGTQNLDFSKELVGQSLSGTFDPFGTTYTGNAGDFQIYSNGSNTTSPDFVGPFTIASSGGAGDKLVLTSFAPVAATAVPFDFNPAEGAALGVPLFVGLGILRKRAARKLTASKAVVGVE